MMQDIFGTEEMFFVVSLVLSLVLGLLIGWERELRHKDAGISTHMMVITGAMLFTFLSNKVDPTSSSRIAAQIVSGIGFLGAGLILKEGSNIKNLTTAASIWFAGAIGMAIGYEYYLVAILASMAAIIVPRIPYARNKNGK